jgi:diketogulonate reductase-like aldo/keto reductase
MFKVSASKYWETHYQFDKESPKKRKRLSSEFIDLLLVNTILPLQFSYADYQGTDKTEDFLELIKQIKAESNTVISKFASVGISSENAFQTQTLLQLKKNYCEKNRCLQCQIGIHLLKN